MNILSRYILGEFAKLLAIALSAFILLFILVDLFENLSGLLKGNVPFLTSVMFFVYKIPSMTSQVLPIAVLLAVLLTLGILSKNGEITAMKAGGIRLLRVLLPIFIAGGAISAAVMFLNEAAVPISLKKVDSIKRQWLGAGQKKSFSAEGIWLRTSQGIVNIKRFDMKKNEINGIVLYVIGKPFNIKEKLTARNAVWRDKRWVADDVASWSFGTDGAVKKTVARSMAMDGLDAPEDLSAIEDAQKNMTLSELSSYIKNLESEGYEAHKYKTDFYGRFTFPLVSFIMVFVGIPFALKTGRTSGIAMGIGLSVVIAFSFWVVFATSRSLGVNGVIPPLLAALLPDLLFFAVGALMLGYVKQ